MNSPKPTKREKYITSEEFAIILDHTKGVVEYMILFITGNLGLRVGEAVRLRKEDFNFKELYVNVPTLKQGGEGKGKPSHNTIKRGVLPKTYNIIPMGKMFMAKVAKYVVDFKIKDGWFFLEKDGLHMPTWKAQKIFKKATNRAKLNPRYSIHSLRHCRGIAVYKKYKDIRAVQSLLRHRNINSSVIYTELDVESNRELTDGLDIIE